MAEVIEIKQMIIDRARIKKERDSLLEGVDVPDMSGGVNPMALMGMVSKVGDFKRAFELTKEMERISDVIVSAWIERLSNNV